MKHLKPYKIFENKKSELPYADIINWELINDLKDMSLEYIDQGCVLNYELNARGRKILEGTFDHENDIYDIDKSAINTLYVYMYNMSYDFKLDVPHHLLYNGNWVSCKRKYETDLLKRIKSVYPDYWIRTLQNKY